MEGANVAYGWIASVLILGIFLFIKELKNKQ